MFNRGFRSAPLFAAERLPPEGGRRPSEQLCKVIFENEQQDPNTPNKPPGAGGRRRSLVSSEPQHVTLIVFGIGMVNRTHLEADIGGLTMEAELKKIHGSFTLKEKMKGEPSVLFPLPQLKATCSSFSTLVCWFQSRFYDWLDCSEGKASPAVDTLQDALLHDLNWSL